MPAKTRELLVAVESFAAKSTGGIDRAGRITRVRPDHPGVKGWEHLFTGDVPDVEEH